MYYHHVTDEVHQLTMYYFSALNSPCFLYFVILGLDPINSSLLPDGSVLVSSTEGHRKAAAVEGAFHSGLGCFIPSAVYSHSLGHWGNPAELTPRGISLPLSKLLSEDQLWSTYIPYQVSQPSGLLLQTSSSLHPLMSLLATSRLCRSIQVGSLHFQ